MKEPCRKSSSPSLLSVQVQLASCVNDSLISLDSLHTAAGGLDTKLQHTMEQQVYTTKMLIFACTCTRPHAGNSGHLRHTRAVSDVHQTRYTCARARFVMLQGALAHRQAEMLQGLSELEAQERKVLAATSALHQVPRDSHTLTTTAELYTCISST